MWDVLVRPIRDHLPLWLLLWPVLGVMLVGLARLVSEEAARRILLVNLLMSLALSFGLVVAYEPLKPVGSMEQAAVLGPLERFQFRDSFEWVGETRTAWLERTLRNGERRVIEVPIRWGPDIRFEVGVDGISVWFVALSVLLVAVGQNSEGGIRKAEDDSLIPNSEFRIPSSNVAWLWLQASLVGTFVALDVVLFVMCWMSTLLAIAWLMGQGGDSQRHDATPRFLKLGWLTGWFVALGLGGLVLAFGWLRPSPSRPEAPLAFAIPDLVTGIRHWGLTGDNAYLWSSVNSWLFWLLVIGFTGPLWLAPFHRGLLEALISAPRSVTIVVAGVFLKIGLYGWLRFIVPLFPDLLHQHFESFATLVGLSSLLAAVLAFGAEDWRRRIALATVSSVGLSLIGVMTLTIEGLMGGLLRVLSHGLTAGLLVWLLPSTNSPRRDRTRWEGVAASEPVTVATCPSELNGTGSAEAAPSQTRRRWLLRFALFAWIGLPGLSGFVAEFVTPFGLFQQDFNVSVLSFATSGLIAWMWVRAERHPPDWSGKAWSSGDTFVAGVLVALNVALGVAPQFLVDRLQPSLEWLVPVDSEASAAAFSRPSSVVEVR